jgi:hypothetical protein
MSNHRFGLAKPRIVAIVAMGGSSSDYTNVCAQQGGRRKVADETWAINAMGDVIEHDRLFAMDDLGDLRGDMRIGKKVATGMLEWMVTHPGPIYTTRRYGNQIPGAVPYPVEEVINMVGFPYLNTSVAYAVAYALYINVKQVKMFGCDFTYAHQHVGESGRGCVEWLLGVAGERGMRVEVSQGTTLLDACVPLEERLYGFDEPVIPMQNPDTGKFHLVFPEREKHKAEQSTSDIIWEGADPEPESTTESGVVPIEDLAPDEEGVA